MVARVQGTPKARSARQTPLRHVNGPTMLAGVARCAKCGAAMILNTGKISYRYYICSRAARQGKTACEGCRIRMDKLDQAVLDHLVAKIFEPARLAELLDADVAQSATGIEKLKEKVRRTREARGDADAAIRWLLILAEKGLLDADPPNSPSAFPSRGFNGTTWTARSNACSAS